MAELAAGAIIRQRREERELTREQLVEKVDGLSVRVLLDIEVHGRLPRVKTLAGIAKALDLSLDDLLEIESAERAS